MNPNSEKVALAMLNRKRNYIDTNLQQELESIREQHQKQKIGLEAALRLIRLQRAKQLGRKKADRKVALITREIRREMREKI